MEATRKGKWTVSFFFSLLLFLSYAEIAFNILTQTEEVAYAEKLRQLFTEGILILSQEEKTMTLRGYLAMKLGCWPERISRKFKGVNSLIKTPYRVNVITIYSVRRLDQAIHTFKLS